MAVVDSLPEELIERDLLKQIQFFKGPLGNFSINYGRNEKSAGQKEFNVL